MNSLKSKSKPTCVGLGLIALDIIMSEISAAPLEIFAGGSCGNVLSILSFLDWETFPIARLKNDVAAKEVVEDLRKWNVRTDLLSNSSDGSTPIIIQRIKRDKLGKLIHKFEFKNPDNGQWLPRYKPVLSNNVSTIIEKRENASVFYFDRVNRAALNLAAHYKAQGAVIYFEPSSLSDDKQVLEALAISDVIKFSNERVRDYGSIFPMPNAILEIETFGTDGLQYRFSANKTQKDWIKVPIYEISNLKDAAGAGDWTSAGIISAICSNGKKGILEISEKDIEDAIKYGQALGAANCLFEGARGMMYNLKRSEMNVIVDKIQKKEFFFGDQPHRIINSTKMTIADLY